VAAQRGGGGNAASVPVVLAWLWSAGTGQAEGEAKGALHVALGTTTCQWEEKGA
jgi:hypothetical protein